MNIGIIGLGLIGGSLARAISKYTNHSVFGYDISSETMQKANLLNAIYKDLEDEDYKNLDMLFVCLTPNAAIKAIENALPKLKDGAIVLDIAGNKGQIVDKMKSFSSKYPALHFVATHPMAGKEFSGIEHSSHLLFQKASILIVPLTADMAILTEIKQLFVEIGFDFVKVTNANEHDRIIAFTSQLAHIISSSYVQNPTAKEHDGFSAGSFKDLTRVAKLSPEMWAELFLGNKDNILHEIDIFAAVLGQFRKAICENDEESLKSLLAEGNIQKEQIDKTTRDWKKNNNENNKY